MLFTSSGHWKFDTSDICFAPRAGKCNILFYARDNPLFSFPREPRILSELQNGEFKTISIYEFYEKSFRFEVQIELRQY